MGTRFIVVFKSIKEVCGCFSPLALSHMHLASTLMYNTHDAWVRNCWLYWQSLMVELLHQHNIYQHKSFVIVLDPSEITTIRYWFAEPVYKFSPHTLLIICNDKNWKLQEWQTNKESCLFMWPKKHRKHLQRRRVPWASCCFWSLCTSVFQWHRLPAIEYLSSGHQFHLPFDMTYAAPSKSGMRNMDNIIKPCVKINCMQPIISHFYRSQEIAQSEHFKTMTHYLTTILIA